EHKVAARDQRSGGDLVGGGRAVENEVGPVSAEDFRGGCLGFSRGALVYQQVAESDDGVVEVGAEYCLAQVFVKDAPHGTTAIEHPAVVARARPHLVTRFVEIDDAPEER